MRRTTLIFLLLAVAAGLALFAVKYQVQDLEQEFAQLNRSITADRQAIRVLEAEWSHLNDLPRLRALAGRYLGMGPIQPEQFADVSELPVPSSQPQGIGEMAFMNALTPPPATLADRKEADAP